MSQTSPLFGDSTLYFLHYLFFLLRDTLMKNIRIENSSKFGLDYLLTMDLSWIVYSLKTFLVHVASMNHILVIISQC